MSGDKEVLFVINRNIRRWIYEAHQVALFLSIENQKAGRLLLKRIVSLREEIDSVEKSVGEAIDLYESLMPDVNVAINSLQSFIDSEE